MQIIIVDGQTNPIHSYHSPVVPRIGEIIAHGASRYRVRSIMYDLDNNTGPNGECLCVFAQIVKL